MNEILNWIFGASMLLLLSTIVIRLFISIINHPVEVFAFSLFVCIISGIGAKISE